jgi:hypothetical protein
MECEGRLTLYWRFEANVFPSACVCTLFCFTKPSDSFLFLKFLQLSCFHYQTVLLQPHECIAFTCTLFRRSARNENIIMSHALPHILSSKRIFVMFGTKGLHHTLWGALRFGRYLFCMTIIQNREEHIYTMRALMKWF